MAEKARAGAPCWLFTVIMIGAFLACGLYLGMMRVEGISTGDLIRAVAFGALGLLMLWGVLGRR